MLDVENSTGDCEPAESTKLVALAVTFDGKPLIEISTCPVNPFRAITETFRNLEVPALRKILCGFRTSLKSGVDGGFSPPQFPPHPHAASMQIDSRAMASSRRGIILPENARDQSSAVRAFC